MNILLIHPYAGSMFHGMQHRPYYLAKEWRMLGHRLTIISASFSHLRRIQPKIERSMTEEEIDGIRYVWLKTKKYKGNGIKRVWNMMEFSLKLIWLNKKLSAAYKPDVVIASSPHPFSIYGANAIARQSNAKLIFEVRDLWPLTLIELGNKSPSHPFIRFMQFTENYAYRMSDYVVSLLPKAHTYLVEHGMEPSKFYYLPNGITGSEWACIRGEIPLEIEELVRTLKAGGKFLIGYAGSHGLANALEYLLEAAYLLREHPVAFILIGDGPDKADLKQRVSNAGIRNVWFFPSIPKYAIPAFLDRMDALFVGLKQESIYRYGISLNKLFDYMMAAKPIIFSGKVGNDLVTEYGCGLSIPPEDPEAISNAVMTLKSLTVEERMVMGKKGRDRMLIEHDLQILARRFAAELEKTEKKQHRKLPIA